MKWQVKYVLEKIAADGGASTAEHVRGELIRITTQDLPDVLAAISGTETITRDIAEQYHKEEPNLDFLCGYKKSCVWEGGAIEYLKVKSIGWGSAATLYSAASEGNANTAEHKVFAYYDRIIRQNRLVDIAQREFDRIYSLKLKNGRNVRVGMIADYEPTADAVRSLWDRFGPVNLVLNINPNGSPTQSAIQAGYELGCEVLKWEDIKENFRRAV